MGMFLNKLIMYVVDFSLMLIVKVARERMLWSYADYGYIGITILI